MDQAQENFNAVDLDEESAMSQAPLAKQQRAKPAGNVFMLEGIDEEESTDVADPNGYIDVADDSYAVTLTDPNNNPGDGYASDDAETDA